MKAIKLGGIKLNPSLTFTNTVRMWIPCIRCSTAFVACLSSSWGQDTALLPEDSHYHVSISYLQPHWKDFHPEQSRGMDAMKQGNFQWYHPPTLNTDLSEHIPDTTASHFEFLHFHKTSLPKKTSLKSNEYDAVEIVSRDPKVCRKWNTLCTVHVKATYRVPP